MIDNHILYCPPLKGKKGRTKSQERRAEICVAGEKGGSEIRNLLRHHDWSHDDRSAPTTIAALYEHTQTHRSPNKDSHWELAEMLIMEPCALRADLILCVSTLGLCWLLIHTFVSPFFFVSFPLWCKGINDFIFIPSRCRAISVFCSSLVRRMCVCVCVCVDVLTVGFPLESFPQFLPLPLHSHSFHSYWQKASQ